MPIVKHIVKQGESLSSIAKQYGFNKAETIYKHPLNDFFRSKRSNPDEIFQGDEIYIPDKEIKSESIVSETDNIITLKNEKCYLNLALYDFFDQGKPLANAPYTLIVGDKTHQGNLDNDGKLSVEISKNDKHAELSFEVKDRTGTSVYNWILDIAHLDPVETPSGIAQRLENIGCMDIDMDKFYSESKKAANLHLLTIAWNAFAHSLQEKINWHDMEEDKLFQLTANQFSVNSQNKDSLLTTNKKAQELLKKHSLCASETTST